MADHKITRDQAFDLLRMAANAPTANSLTLPPSSPRPEHFPVRSADSSGNQIPADGHRQDRSVTAAIWDGSPECRSRSPADHVAVWLPEPPKCNMINSAAEPPIIGMTAHDCGETVRSPGLPDELINMANCASGRSFFPVDHRRRPAGDEAQTIGKDP
jgi:hypothetical protein